MRRVRWMLALLALGGSVLTLQAPAIAAAVDSGEIVAGPIQYDHVSGVANGNVLCSKTLDVLDDGEVVRHTLMGVDGQEKFSYTFVDFDAGFGEQPTSSDYAPVTNARRAMYTDFPQDNGCLILIDVKTGKHVLVNSDGDIVVDDADGIAVMKDGEHAISVKKVGNALRIRLHKVADGSILKQKSGMIGVNTIYTFTFNYDGHWTDPKGDAVYLSTDVGSYFISISNGDIKITPESEQDPNVVFDDDGYLISLINGRLQFELPDGTRKTAPGTFSEADFSQGVISALQNNETQYFTFDGVRILEGYEFDYVNVLKGSDRFFCKNRVSGSGDPAWEYFICDSKGVLKRLGRSSKTRELLNSGAFVFESEVNPQDAGKPYPMPYTTKAYDSNGRVVETWDLSERMRVLELYQLDVNQLPSDGVFYFGYSQATNATSFYSRDFEYLATLDGIEFRTFDEVECEGSTCLSFIYNGEYERDAFSPLYDYRIQPMMIDDMQRIRAGRVSERDNINYVTDGSGHVGAVDDGGNVIIPLEYESIYDAGSDADASHILVKKQGTWHVMRLEGNGPISVDVPVVADLTFNGKTQVPVIAESDLYRVVSNDGGKDAGSYSVELELVDPESTRWADGSAGNKVVSYKIAPRALTDGVKADSIDDQTFAGTAVKPKATLRFDGKLLVEGADYTLTYASNTKPGTGYAVCSGKGNYAGELRIAFSIVKPLSFSDVDGSTPHASHINWLASAGISKGWDNGDGSFSFRPYAIVARADMAAFLYRLAGEPAFDETSAPTFSDVNAGTPHRRAILWLASKGISKGWDNGDGTYSFRPYANVVRADMAAFLYRLAGEPVFNEAEAPGFSDVDGQTPHRKAILWLASSGVSKGWDNGNGTFSFRPYAEVARCDMSAFLHRMEESGLVK